MQNVTTTYYAIWPHGRMKIVTLDGDNLENDIRALKEFESWLSDFLDSYFTSSKKKKMFRLERSVNSEIMSIPLHRTEYTIEDYWGETHQRVGDRANADEAAELLEEAYKTINDYHV